MLWNLDKFDVNSSLYKFLLYPNTIMDLEKERTLRPLAFDKMEKLIREMQNPDSGVPVRSQKLFLSSIPSAFMGYDLIEWLMERLDIEESEALSIANQLCQYGYFFPVNDKNLVVKDDSSLYRFQSPYFWPSQVRSPDNVEYAIYLKKRTLRNKQHHGLEDYELDILNSLKKNLANKWDLITMQAEEQVRLAKERKKGDKIISDSQERAYWRLHKPPPGVVSILEQCPVPNRSRNGSSRIRKPVLEEVQNEVQMLNKILNRTRIKMSTALENMVQSVGTYEEYDPFINAVQPSNPWISEDVTYWQLNEPLVEAPTEKRVKRWALSMEELVSDPTGLQEFTFYLCKEYSHENIRFWLAVNELRRSSQSQVLNKVAEIYDHFLAPGAPCEINIDGKTMEAVNQERRNPSRFSFDSAAEHVYTLLLKKDCYPRFIRSEHYKSLLSNGVQPLQKKRFFGFVGPTKKKQSTAAPQNQVLPPQEPIGPTGAISNLLGRRRGSEHSLSGSVQEIAASSVHDIATFVPHSKSQSNLSNTSYRELANAGCASTDKQTVCSWDSSEVVSTCSTDKNEGGEAPMLEKESNSFKQRNSESSSNLTVNVITDNSDRKQVSGEQTRQKSFSGSLSDKYSSLSTATAIGIRRASVSTVMEAKAQKTDDACPSTSSLKKIIPQRSFDASFLIDNVSCNKSLNPSKPMAPIISVDSVMNETINDAGLCIMENKIVIEEVSTEEEKQVETEDKSTETCSILLQSENQPEEVDSKILELVVPPEPVNMTLAPLAEPDASSPFLEWKAEGEDEKLQTKNNLVCPWESEDTTKTDASFVKTYATLGYL